MDLVRQLVGWAFEQRVDPLPESAVPGTSSEERKALKAVGGVARVLAGDRTTTWPEALKGWTHAAPEPPAVLMESVRRELDGGQDVLALLYEGIVSGRNRRRLGTFFTPTSVVDFMLDSAEEMLPRPAVVIDPGAGVGAFSLAAKRRWPMAEVFAIDVNVATLGLLAARPQADINIVHQDYLAWAVGSTVPASKPPEVDLGERTVLRDATTPQAPYLGRQHRQPILPGAVREGVYVPAALPLLARYPLLDAAQASALLKAARSYQQGVWVAESDPELAWLHLVSALETGAAQWSGKSGDPRERLRGWNQGVYDMLAQCGDDALEAAAAALAPITGSTGRFKEFCLAFLPEPPALRPIEYFKLDWAQMRTHLGAIYKHRSKALHESTPFPALMCMAPVTAKEGTAPAEVPPEALATMGGVWRREDAPMLLHTFEYICRGVLTAWWAQLGSE